MDTWGTAIQSLTVLAAAAIGFLASAATQSAADRRRYVNERASRIDEREHERLLRSHDLQLKALSQLPEALRLVMRDTHLMIDADRKALESTGNFAFPFPADLDASDFSHRIALSALIIQVVDEDLRAELESIRSFCTECTLPPHDWRDLDKAQRLSVVEQRWLSLSRKYEPVAALLGEKLRAELRS